MIKRIKQHLSQLTPMGKTATFVGAGFSGLGLVSLAAAGLSQEAAEVNNWLKITSDAVISVGGLGAIYIGSHGKKTDSFTRINDWRNLGVDTAFAFVAAAAVFSVYAKARGLTASFEPVIRDPQFAISTFRSFAGDAMLASIALTRFYERLRPTSLLSASGRTSYLAPSQHLG